MEENSVDKIYHYLLNMILNGELKPGDKIAEETYAELFSVSRTPIREVFRRLAANGLITIYPRRFAQVSPIEEKDLQDLGLLRIAIEDMAIRLAIYKGSQEEYDALMEIAEQCLDAGKQKNEKQRFSLDRKFHRYLIELSRNKELLNVYEDLDLKIQYILINHPESEKNSIRNLEEHIELVKMIEEGDSKKAVQIAEQHLSSFYGIKLVF